jgi:hypothetical protein
MWWAGVRHTGLKLGFATVMAAFLVGPSGAAEEVSLEGTWMQNRECRGDGTDMKALMVKISPDEISYTGGVCTVSDRRQENKTIRLRATCKTRAGKVIAGDVTFNIRDEKTVEMVDKEKNYNAVLHRCPG